MWLFFGVLELLDGIEVIIMVVVMFVIGEVLVIVGIKVKGDEIVIVVKGLVWMNCKDWVWLWKFWLCGIVIGFFIGVMFVGGVEIGIFLFYVIEKKLFKYFEEFGYGVIEGVVGFEVVNNVSVVGMLVLLLMLGLLILVMVVIMLVGF